MATITFMSGNAIPDIENLCIVPIYSYSETDESNDRAEDAYFGYEYDEKKYRGLRPETIRSILNKVGAVGESPAIATTLFRAGVDTPPISRYCLYKEDLFETSASPAKLFGVYRDGDAITPNTEPDALLLAQGLKRKVYRGHEMIMTDFWSNPDRSDSGTVERTMRDLAQRAMLSDYYYTNYMFADQGSIIHEIMGADEKTVAELGIEPDDYAEGYGRFAPKDRMGLLRGKAVFGERAELLGAYIDLYGELDPDVDFKGGEGEDLYETRLGEDEVDALNRLWRLSGYDRITGVCIDREDRENLGEYRPYGNDDVDPFYTNGWGDMTVRLQLEYVNVVKCYTLRVYMDSGRRETYLNKYVTELAQPQSRLAKEAGHLLASMEDELSNEVHFNEIDEFEYRSVISLVQSIGHITNT